jgi:hypothetical protein
MNGFDAHGIKHSSPSNINTWIASQSRWVASYLFNLNGGTNPAMRRGNAVEEAVKSILLGDAVDDSITRATEAYNKDTAFCTDADARDKERAAIRPMTLLAVNVLAPYGKPDFPDDGQHKISITAKGDSWELPVIGFLDFKFPDHGLVVDLKTTLRMPSEMSLDHQRQRAVYVKSLGNYTVKFLYVTPKKAELLEDGNPDEIIQEIKAHLIRQERFLRLGDRDMLASIVPVDPADFRWKGEEQARKQLFGI